MSRKNKLIETILVPALIIVIAGMLLLYYLFDPEENILFPKCIFHLATGLECPGCGSQRALHQLLSGNITEAFRYNALMVVSLPYLCLWVVLILWKRWAKSETMKVRLGRMIASLYYGNAAYIILTVIIIFWISRNLSPAF